MIMFLPHFSCTFPISSAESAGFPAVERKDAP
jgi:hypothetical protein